LVVSENVLFEGIVLKTLTFFRVNPKIFDQAMTTIVHSFLVEGVAFGELFNSTCDVFGGG
jgi:hypothetical protein